MVIEQVKSIVESILFASDKPVSFKELKSTFNGTDVEVDMVQDAIQKIQTECNSYERGVILEEVAGGYQFRTKTENADFIRRMIKGRPFRLSGPAMEVLSIVAYKQPLIKSEVDQIRGVESGHLLRALMEKNLICFEGKSELPGKPMTYGTTKGFLEIFGLRNLRELPSLSEIDELLPESLGDSGDFSLKEKETLGSLSEKIGLPVGKSFSEAEDELLSITGDLQQISSTTEFFEQEKEREKQRKENDRAQDIRERLVVGEMVDDEDQRWLLRFDKKLEEKARAEEKAKQVRDELAAVAINALVEAEAQEAAGVVVGDGEFTPPDFGAISAAEEIRHVLDVEAANENHTTPATEPEAETPS